jgi:hypothetical protein
MSCGCMPSEWFGAESSNSVIPSDAPALVPSNAPVTATIEQPQAGPTFICHVCGKGSQIFQNDAMIGGRACGDIFQEGLDGKIDEDQCNVYKVSSLCVFCHGIFQRCCEVSQIQNHVLPLYRILLQYHVAACHQNGLVQNLVIQ